MQYIVLTYTSEWSDECWSLSLSFISVFTETLLHFTFITHVHYSLSLSQCFAFEVHSILASKTRTPLAITFFLV